MEKLIKSLTDVEWTVPEQGVKEKRIVLGGKVVRLLQIDGKYESNEWCETGHTGYVLEGSFDLDINGEMNTLNKGSVFFVEGGKFEHRHIPTVHDGEKVRLLLVEDFTE